MAPAHLAHPPNPNTSSAPRCTYRSAPTSPGAPAPPAAPPSLAMSSSPPRGTAPRAAASAADSVCSSITCATSSRISSVAPIASGHRSIQLSLSSRNSANCSCLSRNSKWPMVCTSGTTSRPNRRAVDRIAATSSAEYASGADTHDRRPVKGSMSSHSSSRPVAPCRASHGSSCSRYGTDGGAPFRSKCTSRRATAPAARTPSAEAPEKCI
mmetsp:Transcript_24174/g.83934  ORF Transcript_24174/g.83934 Transcript_24174/m.83934 type:complete len:211 (+) Transcript_24174:1653-2285(+)